MQRDKIGKIIKITGTKVLVKVTEAIFVNRLGVNNLLASYVSIGSIVGAKLVDGRILIMTVEEIYDNDNDIFISAHISGTLDEVTKQFSLGTNAYPIIGEQVFKLWKQILDQIFTPSETAKQSSIGTYVYNGNVSVGYNPDILFGKHLGVFGNTGSGKTCTIVSIIQNYIRTNPYKDVKYIILDVNGEYRNAFEEKEALFIPFEKLNFHHSILSDPEYGRLFRAAEGIQYPVLKDCLTELKKKKTWNLTEIATSINSWVENNTDVQNGKKSDFSRNQLSGYLRSMRLRIDGIIEDKTLMRVINNANEKTSTLETIQNTDKKVIILDLQVSSDTLDVVVFMLFKAFYQYKTSRMGTGHICLVLEEAHRYINSNTDESRLGNYYIDKLSREGRKYGVGLIIASQVPSMLAYEVVSQCNSVIMHKITNKRDMDFLRGVLRVSNDTFYIQMSALEKQHAIVCGEAFPNDSIVRIHNAKPLPQSNDPEIRDLSHMKND